MGVKKMRNTKTANPKTKESVLQFSIVLIVGILFFMASFPPHPLFAGNSNIRFSHISSDDGLSQSTVNCILQDRRGFLWVGTQDGLNRYDGYKFSVFRHEPGNNASLSGNYIWCIIEDREGFLWIGTNSGGLNRFDPHTETFINYKHREGDENSLSHNYVTSIFEDKEGILWIGTEGGGLNRFDPKKVEYRFDSETRAYYYDPKTVNIRRYSSLSGNPVQSPEPNKSPQSKKALDSKASDHVTAICADRSDNLWVGTTSGLYKLVDDGKGVFEKQKFNPVDPKRDFHKKISAIHCDAYGILWVGTDGGGLYEMRMSGNDVFRRYSQKDGQKALSNNTITAIFSDSRNVLWVGTQYGGLNKFKRKNRTFVSYRHKAKVSDCISKDHITSIYEDRSGILWVGTRAGGLNKYCRSTDVFEYYAQDASWPEYRLSDSDIRSVFEDNKGNLWVGTKTGGVDVFAPNGEKIYQHKYDKNNPRSLSNNFVRSITQSRTGDLWIGTFGGGLNEFNPNTEGFTHFRHDPEKKDNSLSDDNVSVVYEDSKGALWVGTKDGGLNQLTDRKNKIFRQFKHKEGGLHSLGHNFVNVIFEDRAGFLWVGTRDGGLSKLVDREKKEFRNFRHNKDKPNSISHNFVQSIYESKSGILWVGTFGGGLNKTTDRENFNVYREKDGLANNVVYGILEDDNGNLWLSTNKGLSQFDPEKETFKNYTVEDGLQANEFNFGALYRSREGKMFFGGINGLNAFRPGDIIHDDTPPPIVIDGFFLFNKPVKPRYGDTGSPLEKPISQTQNLTLSHRQNVFSLEFAALHFASPQKNQYMYRLTGWNNDEWVETDANNRRATYTNLPAGRYEFQVKGSNKDGAWSNDVFIKLRILPPPRKSWWAFLLYFMVGVFFIWFVWNTWFQRDVARKLQEADRIKNEFLSNMSHELRTPLYGVIGIADSLLRGATGELSPETRQNLSMIISSGMRLSYSVTDILDFSSLKKSDLKLDMKLVDLHALVDVVMHISRPLLNGKDIRLLNSIDPKMKKISADENRLQQIMNNLLSNAIKFTETGTVEVTAEIKEKEVVIRVADTGIGIPGDKLDEIFEPFKQVDASGKGRFAGAGLGLAITKKLVGLHNGTISVKSTAGKGAAFTFTLPIIKTMKVGREISHIGIGESLAEFSLSEHYEIEKQIGCATANERRDINILVIDDNPINRKVLINLLREKEYGVTSASSGKEALAILEKEPRFDLVLLDVMMPDMTGYETCEKIRQRWEQTKLPVIFLMTKGREDQEWKNSVSSGGNDFIVKPVLPEELFARVNSHIQLRKKQQKMLQDEKMAALGTLVAGLAHEIRNPAGYSNTSSFNLSKNLEKLRAFIFELAGDNADKEILEDLTERFKQPFKDLDIIRDGISRIEKIVKALIGFSTPTASAVALAHPLDGVKNALILAEAQYGDFVEFVRDFTIDPKLKCNPDELKQVFLPVILNACHAIRKKQKSGGGNAKGRFAVQTYDKSGNAVFSFKDNGVGMAEEIRKKIFDPFFTPMSEREGTGLGLSTAYAIVRKHGGVIDVCSEEGKGTIVKISLPLKRNVFHEVTEGR